MRSPVVISVRAAMALLLAGAAMGVILVARTASGAPTDADRAFVAKTLATVEEDDPSTGVAAEEVFVQRGEGIVAALKEALPKSTGLARRAVDSALVRLEWKIDPTKLIRASVGEQPERILEQISPVLVSDDSMARSFPTQRFYLVAFRQFPVAQAIPKPLEARNIFVLTRDGKVRHIPDEAGLIAFFQSNLAPVKGDAGVVDAVVSWLEVSKEITQDGMFRFKLPIDEVKAEKLDAGWRGTGRVTTESRIGNSGAIGVTMTFGTDGELTDVAQVANLKAGVRPICQATRLLDPDPVVRKMAERDLLVMGTLARDYIFEQRAKATPELRAEIDRVWRLILDREHVGEIPVP